MYSFQLCLCFTISVTLLVCLDSSYGLYIQENDADGDQVIQVINKGSTNSLSELRQISSQSRFKRGDFERFGYTSAYGANTDSLRLSEQAFKLEEETRKLLGKQ